MLKHPHPAPLVAGQPHQLINEASRLAFRPALAWQSDDLFREGIVTAPSGFLIVV